MTGVNMRELKDVAISITCTKILNYCNCTKLIFNYKLFDSHINNTGLLLRL